MPTFATSPLPVPESWKEFEKIARDIYARLWQDPNAELNGRDGQSQHGVDVYGQPWDLQGRYVGVQCKRYRETKLTKTKIIKEIKKAEQFTPKLFEYIIVTTEVKDGALQEIVREINVERLANQKFPVRLVFWEDLCTNYLAHPDYRDLLREIARKHYSDWVNLFSEIKALESSSIFQISVEREHNLGSLTLQERHLQERLEVLRAEANNGYKEAIQPQVSALVSDMENIAQDANLDSELQGQVYRLAANVVLPNRPGGDTKQCRNYLLKARTFSSSGDGLVKCQIIEALLAYLTRGLDVALAMVDDIEGKEADRFRFSMYLENNEWAACTTLLQTYKETDLSNTKDWLRLLVLYYAGVGNRVKLEEISEQLLASISHADHYMMAGFAWVRLAYRQYQHFCEKHDVCPALHIELALDELIDFEARQQALDMFARAFEIYREKNCILTAQQALLTAIQLAMDESDSKRLDQLLEQLQALDPQHPLVILKRDEIRLSKLAKPEAVTEQLEKLLIDSETDLALGLALDVSQEDETITKQVAYLLAHHQTRFEHDDIASVQFLYKVFHLHMQADAQPEAKTWLDSLSPPERYGHLQPLLQFIFYIKHDPPLAPQYLEQALEKYPEHPEILAVATKYYWGQGDYQRQIEYARKLFAILPIASVAIEILNALIAAQNYDVFLQGVSEFESLSIPEEAIKSKCAYAHLRLGQPLNALEHLEWLHNQNKARLDELINLARILQYLGQWGDAFAVLGDCVQLYPEEPEAYLELSQAYLDAGQRDESFQWAMKARSRFRYNANVAVHLVQVSHLTGFEHRSDIQKVFQEFSLGGRFESTGYMRPASLEEIRSALKSHRDFSESLETSYRQGKISSMMLCYLQPGFPNALFRFHIISTQFKLPRYVAAGDQPFDAAWLKKNNPKEVVLDYTAILTLWSLYRDDWLDTLRHNFRQVWVPDKLLQAMYSEQRLMRQYGQPSQYKIQRAIRDVIEQKPGKFHIHSQADSVDSWGVTGIHAEALIAEEKNLPYLSEYDNDELISTTQNIGLRSVARVLKKSGEINNKTHQHLTSQARRRTRSENRLVLPKESGLVVAMPALITIVNAGALEEFCDYYGEIHLSQSAWQRILAQIAEFERTEEMIRELRHLQSMLGEAVQDGFVQVGAASPDQRLLLQAEQDKKDDNTPTEDANSLRDIKQFLSEYLDDLLWIAHSRQLSIWADDRWMSKFYPNERRPIFIFGTDSFLEWARRKSSDDDEYFDRYSRIIEWGYLGLPLHPNYILWLLNQDLQPEAKIFAAALSLYRQYVIDIWNAFRITGEISAEFGTKLFDLYNQAIISTLFQCFEQGILLKTCADIFRALDLTRNTSLAEGNEPQFLASLIIRGVNDDCLAQLDGVEEYLTNWAQFVNFNRWLDKVLQTSGVTTEVIQEAWYELLQSPIAMYDSAKNEQDRLIATLFSQRLFDAAPDHAKDYLVNSTLEPTMRQAFGFDAQYSIIFTSSDGTIRAKIPAEEWSKDINQAITEFVTTESSDPITVGTATIQANWVAYGSIFLRYKEFPSELHNDQPDAKFLDGDSISILPYATSENMKERLGFWFQGLRKLKKMDGDYDEWLMLCNDIESESSADVTEAGHRLQCILFGQLTIAKDYLTEATQIGSQAILHVLAHIEPQVVRRWLDLPQLDWETSDSLTTWAKTGIDELLSNANDTARIDLLINNYSSFGYSIFPDALVWQEAIDQSLEDCSLAELRRAIDDLAILSEKSRSMPLKANVLLSLLRLEQIIDDAELEASISERIHKLTACIAQPWKSTDEQDRSYQKLEQTLCDYLYMAWLKQNSSDQDVLREIAYLAYLGAAIITDMLASSGLLLLEYIDDLIRELTTVAQKRWTKEGIVARQPHGIFKPRWGVNLNYALAYLLRVNILNQLHLGKLATNSTTRQTLLDAGSLYRLIQAYIPNLSPKEDWLDSLLVADIGQGIAYIISTALGDELEIWPEEEQVKFNICSTPETGVAMIAERLRNLPAANENEISHIVGMSFVSAPTWSEEAYQLVAVLLYPDILNQIMRFPVAYGELVAQLIYLLATDETLSTELANQAKNLVFGLPPQLDNRSDLIVTQARVLSGVINFTPYTKNIETWLKDLTTDTVIETSMVRRGLMPFVKSWPHYEYEIKQIVGKALAEIATIPRFSNLWELKRISREFTPQ